MIASENQNGKDRTREQLVAIFKQANEHRDYKIYEGAMDAALEAKARSLFPHFGDIEPGDVIVDAGSGTGKLAELAATEFREARVMALDISHELQESAGEDQSKTALVYGDAREQNFPENSIKVKYFSTSGHEVETFGGKGSMERAMQNTFKELVPGGTMIVRDFAKPSRQEPIFMEILSNTGVQNVPEGTDPKDIDYNVLSTTALFERFVREFDGGSAFAYTKVEIDGKTYIKISPEWAHEFYLRKDYTGNWRQEIKEKYTYWTPEQAEEILKKSGYTNVRVIPDPNEYIVSKRLKGKIGLHEMVDGKLVPYDFPPTHMVVIGEKPKDEKNEEPRKGDVAGVDYQEVLSHIVYDKKEHTVRIGDQTFLVTGDEPKIGMKKMIFTLRGEPQRILKVVRPDTLSHHNTFKSMYQIVEHQKVLEAYKVPHLKILEHDSDKPPFRYVIQEAVTEGAISVAELIEQDALTPEDINQLCSVVNDLERDKQWQLDTNPHSWFRVKKENGETQLVYVSSKVYRYDERWEFRKVGLLQWTDKDYVQNAQHFSARVPTMKAYAAFQEAWETNPEFAAVWKKNLHPDIQPSAV